jgi:hypothetical protein
VQGGARCHRRRGELEQARQFAEQALRLETRPGGGGGRARPRPELAAIEQAAGRTAQARACATDAVRIHQRRGHRLAEVRAQRILG